MTSERFYTCLGCGHDDVPEFTLTPDRAGHIWYTWRGGWGQCPGPIVEDGVALGDDSEPESGMVIGGVDVG